MTRLELWITVAVVFLTGVAFGFYISQSGWHTERDVLRDSVSTLQKKVDLLGELALKANEQWIVCLNDREKYIERYRSIAINCAEDLRFFRPESTQVIDGILYERAAGAKTAWNNGVADEH